MQGADAVLTALSALGYGCVILDNVGRVLRTNEKAARYLGRSLELRGRAGDDRDGIHRSLQLAIRDALRAATVINPRLGYIVAVERGSRRPLLLRSVQVVEEDEEFGATSSGSVAALVLLDLEDCPQPDALMLRQIFKLTPAECRLAQRLCMGHNLQDISTGLKIGVGTLRMQLKAVFWKTGTRRQAELVALLSHLSRLNSH